MWSKLPWDVLANIFSFLSPESLARARSACRNWNACVKAYPLTPTRCRAWLLALPIRNHRACYAHDPVTERWHQLSLQFLPVAAVRAVAPIGSLLLLRVTATLPLRLVLCNPFTRQFKLLPRMNISRTNPAVGVTLLEEEDAVSVQFPRFRVYAVGGMSEAEQGRGGAAYEPTAEMYDSKLEAWQIVGPMPVEFAVRLTVWTPNESVYVNDTVYWITSARAYSVMGFHITTNTWKELGVPMPETLEFATLVRWNGALALIAAAAAVAACIWQLNEGDTWCLADTVPHELGLRLLAGNTNWDSVKCVGNEDAICLYRDLGSGMVVCHKNKTGDKAQCQCEWVWVDGCGYIKGKQVRNCPIRATLIHPTLASSLPFETTLKSDSQ